MYIHKHDAVFIHIPKCGGCSIMDYFNVKENIPEKVHYKVSDYIKENKNQYNKSFSFTMIRNSYQQIISMWKYCSLIYNNLKDITFKEFLFDDSAQIKNLKNACKQLDYLSFNNQIHVDYIGNINNSYKSLQDICNLMKITFNNNIPKSNSTNIKYYESYLDSENIKKIEEIFKDDILHFGFDPFNYNTANSVGYTTKLKQKLI